MRKKKLYIIGNGFDLAHKLPTSYGDFHDWLNGTHYELDNSEDDSQFIYAMDDIFINAVDDGEDIDLWSDFENALGHLQIGEYVKRLAKENEVTDPDDEHYKDPSDLSEKVYAHVEYTAKQTALNELRRQFKRWIKTIEVYDDIEPKYIDDIDKEAIYLSFNYTNTLEKIYNIHPEQVFHIHGFASDPNSTIIVGHETEYKTIDYIEVEEQLFGADGDIFPTMVESMNELQKNTKHIISENKKWFDALRTQGIQEIYLYGLSFGEIDDEYFKEIRKQLPNASWRFAVYAPSEKVEKSNIRRIQNFIKRIDINKNKCSAFNQDPFEGETIDLF